MRNRVLGLSLLLCACKSLNSTSSESVKESAIYSESSSETTRASLFNQIDKAPPAKIWRNWNDVAADLLAESSLNPSKGQATLETLAAAFDFCLGQRDFARAEWLNLYWSNSTDPKLQSIGAYNSGRISAQLGHFEKTEEAWKKALSLDPENIFLQKQLGILYANFGFFAKALLLLRDLDNDPTVAITLVTIERQLGLNEIADRHCEILLSLPPFRAEAYYNCSLLEFQNHRNAKQAILWMTEAAQLASSNSPLAREARSQLIHMQEWKAKFQYDR